MVGFTLYGQDRMLWGAASREVFQVCADDVRWIAIPELHNTRIATSFVCLKRAFLPAQQVSPNTFWVVF